MSLLAYMTIYANLYDYKSKLYILGGLTSQKRIVSCNQYRYHLSAGTIITVRCFTYQDKQIPAAAATSVEADLRTGFVDLNSNA